VDAAQAAPEPGGYPRRATDTNLNRDGAIKVLPAEVALTRRLAPGEQSFRLQ
jgi:hypothetical protein